MMIWILQNCTLCDRADGAVIQCSECPAEFHVSCALKQGHKFGFEIQQVRRCVVRDS